MSFETHTGGLSPQEIEQQMLTERKKETHGRGLEVIRDVVGGFDRLTANGVLVEDTVRRVPEHQQRFVPGAGDVAGGWHDVKVQEGTKFMRMTFVKPRDPLANPDGNIEIEFADKELRNGKYEPSTANTTKSRIVIAVDKENALHIHGIDKRFNFNVDYPNKNSMYNDFNVANQILDDAIVGVADLVSRPPVAPAPPVQ